MLFWERFYDLCIKNNTKPNTVCNLLGLSTATATHWKNGTVPKADAVLAISDHFGVSTDYLLGRAEKQQEEQQITPTENDEGDRNKQRLLRNYDDMNESAQEHIANYSDFMVSNETNLKSDIQNNKMNA